jgi:hypothetical protein
VNLDGSGANAEVIGDGFVGKTLRQAIEDIALARSQRLQADGRIAYPVLGRALAVEAAIAFLERGKERILLERLFDEIDRAALHRPHRQADVAMTGHDDHRQADAFVLKRLLNLETVHSRHSDV